MSKKNKYGIFNCLVATPLGIMRLSQWDNIKNEKEVTKDKKRDKLFKKKEVAEDE